MAMLVEGHVSAARDVRCNQPKTWAYVPASISVRLKTVPIQAFVDNPACPLPSAVEVVNAQVNASPHCPAAPRAIN